MTVEPGRLADEESSRDATLAEAQQTHSVRLQVSATDKLNLAAFQNAVPVLHALAVVNACGVVINIAQMR